MKKIILTFLLCFPLISCGFSPMYGKGQQASHDIQTVLARVQINNIPDREGQFLRNALIDRFYVNGRPAEPAYILTVSKISEQTYDLDITKSSDATRAQLKLRTTMNLKDAQTGDVVLTRKLQAISSYNVLTSEFATRVSENNTRENALTELARQIEQQIGLYLKRL